MTDDNDDLPQAHFGSIADQPVNWREVEDEPDPDDEEIETPPDVVMALGFDPAKETTEDESRADAEHRYKPLLRPASRSTLPEGVSWEFVEAPDYVNRPDLPRSSWRYGIIKTSRALTAEEIEHFDLQPV